MQKSVSMRKSTSINFKAVLIALFVVSLGIEMVSAAGFPFGLRNCMAAINLVENALMLTWFLERRARLRFLRQRVIIWPCCRASQKNELKVLGFFGYGGGVTLTYNQEDGTLKGETPTAVFCEWE